MMKRSPDDYDEEEVKEIGGDQVKYRERGEEGEEGGEEDDEEEK